MSDTPQPSNEHLTCESAVEAHANIIMSHLASVLQSEYDRHMASYKRGWRGCIVAAKTVVELATLLQVKIREEPRRQ